jgi:hypothetical protein
MLTFDTARALAAALAASHRAIIVDPDDARPWLATLEAALALIPGAGPVLATVRGLVEGASESVAGLALPTPWGTAVLLTPRAMVDPAAYLATVTHELVHASQVVHLGAGQTAADYINPELRALREAEAGGVGLWARYLVTGARPSPEDAGVVRSGLYHLGADDKAFGRAVVASLLAPIDTGAIPPHGVARELLAWLHEHAPGAVVVEAYANRATAVP